MGPSNSCSCCFLCLECLSQWCLPFKIFQANTYLSSKSIHWSPPSWNCYLNFPGWIVHSFFCTLVLHLVWTSYHRISGACMLACFFLPFYTVSFSVARMSLCFVFFSLPSFTLWSCTHLLALTYHILKLELGIDTRQSYLDFTHIPPLLLCGPMPYDGWKAPFQIIGPNTDSESWTLTHSTKFLAMLCILPGPWWACIFGSYSLYTGLWTLPILSILIR